MKPFINKIFLAFNGMPMQECKTHKDARVLRQAVLERQNELQDGDFSEDKLTIVQLKMFKLEN